MAGEKVTVWFGGVAQAFVLGEKGKSPVGTAKFSLKVKAKDGAAEANPAAAFSLKWAKGDFDSALADEGLTGDATVSKVARTVPVVLLFDGGYYEADVGLTWSAKADSSGSGK